MAEARPEHPPLPFHGLPSESDCFGNTLSSYSEGSAVMDICVKTEPDDQDISHSAYCAEVQGFSAEEMCSGLCLNTNQIKSEIIMVNIKEDSADLQLCSTTGVFCLLSDNSNSSTCLSTKECKLETGEVQVLQHSQLQESSCTEKEIKKATHYGIKEEYGNLQIHEVSTFPSPLSSHYKLERDEVNVELLSQFPRSSPIETAGNEAGNYSKKEEYADPQMNELGTFSCSLSIEYKSEMDEADVERQSQLEGYSAIDSTVTEAVDDLLHKNSLKLENSLNIVGDNTQRKSALDQSVVPVTVGITPQAMKESCHDGVTHEAQKWQCLHCRKVLKSRSGLKIHLQIHSVDKYFCVQCGTAFSRSSHLKRHQLVHSGAKLYKCSQCGKTFSRRDGLKRHQVSHCTERQCTHSQCGKKGSCWSLLDQHESFQSNKKYKCTHCGKNFSSQNYLKRHEFFHSGLKPYKCSECGKNFSQSCNLKQHQLIHSGEKPYKCSECGKSFALGGHLKQHQLVHFGEKPYTCNQCGKSFSRGNNLKRHQLIHSDEKPYNCSECGKSFPREDRFKQHQRVHSGEKPYICSECGKGFSREDRLKQHQLVHSGEKPYICNECGKSFSRADRLKQHRFVHSEKKVSST